MNRISMIMDAGTVKYIVNRTELKKGQRLRLKLRNDSGEWEEFTGTVTDGATLGIAPTKSHADELWVTIPGFHDFTVSYLRSCRTELTCI